MARAPLIRLARLAAVLLLVVALPRGARADVRGEARQHFRKGMSLIQAGKVDAGVAELDVAYQLLPNPAVLYNIGRAYAEAGDPSKAIDSFQRYLKWDPPDRKEIERTIQALEQQVAARKVEAPPAAGPRPPAAGRPPGSPAATGAATGAAGPPATAAATPQEIAELKATARQLGALAAAARSHDLETRAKALDTLARRLKTRTVVAPEATATTGTKAPGTGPGKQTVSPTPPAGTKPPAGAKVAGTAPTGRPGQAASGSHLEQLIRETAPRIGMDVYKEEVVSASRFAQSPLDAPNSTTIVTAQDIRLSGITDIAELLRRAAGVDVMTLTPGDSEVSIRGLNQRLSNKVLVLVDGRSVFLDFIGATLWQALPVDVSDIQRIEIIRGPASSLYGADAFAGVINIITREPGDGRSQITGGLGTGESARTAVSLTGRGATGFSYRFSGGYHREDNYSISVAPGRVDVKPYATNPYVGLERAYVDADLRYRIADGWLARAGTAVSSFNLAFQGISQLRELEAQNGFFSQTYASLQTPVGLTVRSFWNVFMGDVGAVASVPGGIPVQTGSIVSQVADVEAAWSRRLHVLGLEHDLAVGAGYRFKSIHWQWLDADHQENHFSLFAEDAVRVSKKLQLTVGGRADRHPLIPGLQFSGRASLVLHPADHIAIRASAGNAFRTPTFLESYLDFKNPSPFRAVTALGLGNTRLQPERMVSTELGYAQHLGEVASVEINGYYNLIDNEIVLGAITPYTLANTPGYQSGASAYPVGSLQFVNLPATFQQVGADVGVRVAPIDGLDLYANYELSDTTPQNAAVKLGGLEKDHRTSTHKVNGGVQYRSPFGLDVAVDVHWVSPQTWVEQVADAQTGVRYGIYPLPAYTLVDARLGWRLAHDRLELSVVAENLLDDAHREHPFGQILRRRVWGTATLHFWTCSWATCAVATVPGGIPVQTGNIVSQVADVEAAWSRRLHVLGLEHDLAVGAGYRFKSIHWQWLDQDHQENHFSLFAEDAVRVSRKLQLTVGGRADRHPLIPGLQFSGRASVVLHPADHIAIRASAGNAFRTPTFLESYLDFKNPSPFRAVTALGLGNTRLQPERMVSTELGYAQHLGEIASVEVNGYYNLIDNEIVLGAITPYTLANTPGYQSGAAAYPVGSLQFVNLPTTFRQVGADVGVRVAPLDGLDVYANYELSDTAPQDVAVKLGGLEKDHRTSTHKVNGGVQYRSRFGLDVAVDVHWVSPQTWVEQVADAQTGVRYGIYPLPAYTLVDARLGWRLAHDRLELSVVAENLLDDAHREHPFGQVLRRRVWGTATLHF